MWNWEAVSAIGQLVGAIAVVSTLIYFAVQVRYAKLSAADNNRLARARGVTDYFLKAAASPEIRAANTKAWKMEGFYEEVGKELGVTADEACILDHCHGYWFWLHWGQFTSTTEERDLEELRSMVRKFYAAPNVRLFWEKSPVVKSLLDQPFVDFVDEVLARHDAAMQAKSA